MPRFSPLHVPAYRRHKKSGRAMVTLGGQDHYLGAFGTADSKAEYNRLIAEWLAGGRRLPDETQGTTVAQLASAFRKHAATYYRRADGTPTGEPLAFDAALKPMLRLFGKCEAVAFSPLRLKAVQDEMIRLGWARTSINKHLARIRHLFKWGASQELVPASVFHSLQCVAGLRAGRSAARETDPIRPVAPEHVEATIPFVSKPVAAMIRLQQLTGARSGEIVVMRTADIDTAGKIWKYTPATHKNQYRGHVREIFLGPRAQEVLRPFLKLDTLAYLFSPHDAEAERRAAASAKRKTPASYGNRPGTNRVRKPKRQPGERYDTGSYARAITIACRAAFPAPEHLRRQPGETLKAFKARQTPQEREALAKWRREHHWHPHMIRHAVATELRRTHGIEGAQVALGHRELRATEIYAERSNEAAERIAAQVG